MAQLELRVIKPKRFINPITMRTLIQQAYRDAAQDAKRDLEKTTATWDERVVFQVSTPPIGGATISTNSKTFNLVSEEGSPRHLIYPKRAGRLRFTVPFRAKTRPGVIGSSSGSKGTTVIKTNVVRHPGFQARRFYEAVARKHEQRLVRAVNAAIAREA